jgi:hypothetical protein
VNAPSHWHRNPADSRIAETPIAVGDGLPSSLESDGRDFRGAGGYLSPWGATLIGVRSVKIRQLVNFGQGATR